MPLFFKDKAFQYPSRHSDEAEHVDKASAFFLLPEPTPFIAMPFRTRARDNNDLDIDPAAIHSPYFYPGIYSRSGFDFMKIMHRLATRPNPRIQLGPVDASCSIVLCDLRLPDMPIVYASDPFLQMTGYVRSEVLGRNGRFLQAPPGKAVAGQPSACSEARQAMREAIAENVDVQVKITNFRKDGTAFVNLLTLIPILWSEDDEDQVPSGIQTGEDSQATYCYSVGFLCDLGAVQ